MKLAFLQIILVFCFAFSSLSCSLSCFTLLEEAQEQLFMLEFRVKDFKLRKIWKSLDNLQTIQEEIKKECDELPSFSDFDVDFQTIKTCKGILDHLVNLAIEGQEEYKTQQVVGKLVEFSSYFETLCLREEMINFEKHQSFDDKIKANINSKRLIKI